MPVTQRAIAKALGLNESRVSTMKRQGMPVDSIEAAAAWYCRNIDHKSGKLTSPPPEQAEALQEVFDLQAERARREHHEANLAEMKSAQQRGELLPEEEVIAGWKTILSSVRAKLLALPSKLAARAYAAKDRQAVETLLRNGIHEALQELSEDGKPHSKRRA